MPWKTPRCQRSCCNVLQCVAVLQWHYHGRRKDANGHGTCHARFGTKDAHNLMRLLSLLSLVPKFSVSCVFHCVLCLSSCASCICHFGMLLKHVLIDHARPVLCYSGRLLFAVCVLKRRLVSFTFLFPCVIWYWNLLCFTNNEGSVILDTPLVSICAPKHQSHFSN